MKLLERWHSYGLGRDAVHGSWPRIIRHDLQALRTTSGVGLVLLMAFSFYPAMIEQEMEKLAFYGGCALVCFFVLVWSMAMTSLGKLPRRGVLVAFLVFFTVVVFFSLYIGVITNTDNVAASYLLFVVCAQIFFVMPPWLNLVLNLGAYGLLCLLSISLKPPELWQLDLVNGSTAALAGVTFNWYVAHVVVKGIITADSLELERNRFKEESSTDALTGLANRRDLARAIPMQLAQCRSQQRNICVMVMDVDYFKQYNDTYGHPAGDEVLRRISEMLAGQCADGQVYAARIGGEEFMLLWPEGYGGRADDFAQTVRRAVIGLDIPHEKSLAAPRVTASFGLHIQEPQALSLSIEEFYEYADKALYEAKKQGRNMVVRYDDRTGRYRLLASREQPA